VGDGAPMWGRAPGIEGGTDNQKKKGEKGLQSLSGTVLACRGEKTESVCRRRGMVRRKKAG